MIEISVGKEIPVVNAKFGSSSRGDYFKVPVKAERGYDKIDVWATNPKEANDIVGMAKVESIKSVKLGAHQYNNKWYTDYTVNAKLVQGNPEAAFEQAEPVEDDELPFK